MNMAMKMDVMVLIFYFLCELSRIPVEGIKSTTMVFEDTVPVKADIKKIAITDHGDVYDCVDIYKQPSLRHPLLKDHIVQTRPSAAFMQELKSTSLKGKTSGIQYAKVSTLKSPYEPGTVPIPRKRNNTHIYPLQEGNGLHFAGIQTKKDPGIIYRGALAHISTYNPEVKDHQSSGAIISLEREQEYIKVGWVVDPDLYGNTSTRLFTKWDNSFRKGCYNLQCMGFVVTNSLLPIDYVISNISEVYGERYECGIGVQQDKETLNWVYFIYSWVGTELDFRMVGYWPHALFMDHLSKGADFIRMGGEVNSRLDDSSYPPMGTGYFTAGDYRMTSYFNQVVFLNSTYQIVIPDNAYMERIWFRCYIAGDNSYKDFQDFRYAFLFGGTGGDDLSCLV